MTPPLLRYFWFHSTVLLPHAVCSLRSAVCSLRSAVCGLRSAVCGLRSAVCKCHTPCLESWIGLPKLWRMDRIWTSRKQRPGLIYLESEGVLAFAFLLRGGWIISSLSVKSRLISSCPWNMSNIIMTQGRAFIQHLNPSTFRIISSTISCPSQSVL